MLEAQAHSMGDVCVIAPPQRRRGDGGSLLFFSSRRRHTRYWRDWSSDVCSSDLSAVQTVRVRPARFTRPRATNASPAAGAIRFSLYSTESTAASAGISVYAA